ncbi:hypothetical protein Sez_1863 [Streptococcus equi subsp. zooepidemicus MGCS10565]|uniref:Uncharacterized protein n=1 Tax=Streptococcus equi subsp. zooepidemicus (strain MGCS10565) TaxID=552526 RepID=B4U0H8_STREM|nr:hypothetical protein Sez_1863 [Streptococcus equi subsp. zooepidemicus MGCS10565]
MTEPFDKITPLRLFEMKLRKLTVTIGFKQKAVIGYFVTYSK